MLPVARFEHERHQRRTPSAEDDRRDRHAPRIFRARRPARALLRRNREARIRMRGRTVLGVVRAALPVLHRRTGQAFPPRLVVVGDGDVGEDRIVFRRRERVRIRRCAGARRDAEVAGFRIDRPQASVGTRRHPADVVADRPDFPAGFAIAFRRNQHREIGLAARGRKRRGDVMRFALRILDADDQHVLGEPAFGARLPARDAQRMALLAEQRVAAVAGADRLDRELFREVHDEALLGIELADRVQAFDECRLRAARSRFGTLALDALERRRAHARHDAHVGDDIRRIGDLDAAARDRRIDRAHAVRDHVHRAPAHRAFEQRIDFRVRLRPGPSSCCSGRRRPCSACRRTSGARRARHRSDWSDAASSSDAFRRSAGSACRRAPSAR